MTRRTRLNPAATSADAVNPKDVGYDLIILAGQSNMSGRGVPFDSSLDPSDTRVMQYGNSGTYANAISIASEPLAMLDTPTGIGPGLAFARWYASSVNPNRRVLLVPVAIGSTSLTSASAPTWKSSVSGSYYSNMVTQTQAALTEAGTNSRVVACLWIQGETDGDNTATGAAYQAALDALIVKLRTDLAAPNLPFVIGQMVPEYLPRGTRGAINTYQAATPSRVARTAFAWAPFGKSRLDGNHYNGSGQRTIARTMFDAYRRIIDSAADPALPSVPGQPVPVVSSPTAANYVVTWPAVSGALSYYVEQSATSGGTYTGATIGVTAGTSTTVTRLSSGVDEYVRVWAINNAGPGTAATPVLAPGDTTAPTTPGTPTATGGVTSASVAFTGSTDNIAVTGYRVYSSSDTYTAVVASGASSPISVSGLAAGVAVTFKVAAYDAAGNLSPKSAASNSVTPTAGGDTTAPSTPGTPTATAGVTSATVTFTGSTDNVAVTGYRVYSSADSYASPVGSGSASPVTVTGLTAGVAVTLKVAAYDAAGNESTKSAASNSVTPTSSGSAFINDTFTDTAGVNLTAHTPETGSTWIKRTGFPNDFNISAAGRVYATTTPAYINQTAPPSADYTLSADLYFASLVTSQSTRLQGRVLDAATLTNYEIRYETASLTFTLQKLVSGTRTNLGSYAYTPTAGEVVHVDLVMAGTSLTVKINGTSRITATDSAVTAAGFVAIQTAGAGSTTTTGAHFDNITAG